MLKESVANGRVRSLTKERLAATMKAGLRAAFGTMVSLRSEMAALAQRMKS